MSAWKKPYHQGPTRVGFTIIELIVAIGVTVILVLGVGRIFSMTKTTISMGEATAELSQYGRTLERLMRQDFENMTRDGFLVIRNERIGIPKARNDGKIDERIRSGVNNRPVYVDEKSWKEEDQTGIPHDMGVRRIDQIAFFAIGDYSSYQFRNAYGDGFGGRGIIARNDVSAVARIWYGHGLRSLNLYNSADIDPASAEAEIKRGVGLNEYRAKFADKEFDPKDPTKPDGTFKGDGANFYAQDWILARQAALVIRRESADADQLSSSFRSLDFAPSFIEYFNESTNYYRTPPFSMPVYSVNDRKEYHSLRRRLSPGMVDMIDMDLSEVEKAITDYGWVYLEQGFRGFNRGEVAFYTDPIGNRLKSFSDWIQNAQKNADGPAYSYVQDQRDRDLIDRDISEQWLRGQWIRMALGTGRMRVETTPPSQSRYDQMLTHATLTPGCSNFEVAWSTGEVDYPSGEVVWYDIDQPANPYVEGFIPGSDGTEQESRRERRERAPSDPNIWYSSEIPPAAITGRSPFGGPLWPGTGDLLEDQAEDLYYATFGYFVPKVREGRNRQSLQKREDRSQAWPWPKMIRIRVTLHDQRGRVAGGRSFEYVFNVPPAPSS